jgi:transcriptional regulator GlxA family with amidase domain
VSGPRPTSPRTAPEVFEEATKVAADRLRRDSELFDDPRVITIFARLARGLLDPALDVEAWRRRSAVSRRIYDQFTAKLGPLKGYLDELRIGVAASLVRETDLSLEEIGRSVGMGVPRTFRRTFQRVMGVSPRELRLSSGATTAAGTAASRGLPKRRSGGDG